MTLDRIYGNSISPKSFADGLNFWRNELFNEAATKLDHDDRFSLKANSKNVFGTLIAKKSSGEVQIVHDKKIPILIGQYIEIRAKIRLVSGSAQSAQIIAVPVNSRNQVMVGAPSEGPLTPLSADGTITISAVFGSGNRLGVDMAWGLNFEQFYGGIALNGSGNAEIEIESFEVLDATGHFLATNADWVDIRDFGALGNGEHDCRDAFVAADKAANGRAIFIPNGDFFISSDLTILSPVRAFGRITCDDDTAVMLVDQYNLHTYVKVFKDENFALQKALQALFRFTDHCMLDLCGRNINLSAPIDLQKIVKVTTRAITPRRIHNGKLAAARSSAWDTVITQCKANWDRKSSNILTNVTDIENIQLGSLVQGAGVGREVYVIGVDIENKTLKLSSNISHAEATQNYQFSRFQFMLDCSGFTNLGRFELSNIVMDCNSRASGWMLAQFGRDCRFADSWVSDPKDRGILSFNEGCGSFSMDRCLFNSRERNTSPTKRTTIAVSTRKHDIKIRDNVATYFRHFAFMDGSGHVIHGNHFFQGVPGGATERSAGIVITFKRAKTVIVGNYIDNSWIEITDEQSAYYGDKSSSVFGSVSITGNIFTANTVSNDFSWLKIRTNGKNSTIDGYICTNNTFYVTGSNTVYRVDRVVDDRGQLDMSRCVNLRFENNSFEGVNQATITPVTRTIKQGTAKSKWVADFSKFLPFNGQVLRAESVVALEDLSPNNYPSIGLAKGANGQSAELNFPQSTKGSVSLKVGADLSD